MRTTTDVPALFGSCCFYAAVAMAAPGAEARVVVTDVTASGSSYSSCAAAVTATATDLAASK